MPDLPPDTRDGRSGDNRDWVSLQRRRHRGHFYPTSRSPLYRAYPCCSRPHRSLLHRGRGRLITGDVFGPPSRYSPAWEVASSPERRSAWVVPDHPARSKYASRQKGLDVDEGSVQRRRPHHRIPSRMTGSEELRTRFHLRPIRPNRLRRRPRERRRRDW